MTKNERQVRAVNDGINAVTRELRKCRDICYNSGWPIRGITFRVLKDGTTTVHVTYQRRK